MSRFILQLIAMCTMLIDHMGALLFNNNIPCRVIGRIAFPIYAFLLIDGYLHYGEDSGRVVKHLGFLGFFALITEFVYDFARNGYSSIDIMMQEQNVLFTLFLGLAGVAALDKLWNMPLCAVSIAAFCASINYLVNGNYSLYGVLLIYGLYLYEKAIIDKNIGIRCIFLGILFLAFVFLYHVMKTGWVLPTNRLWLFYSVYIVPIAIILLYNRKQGYTSSWTKICYKYFYPVHLTVIGCVAYYLRSVK